MKQEFNEYDVILATRDLTSKVQKNAMGTILMIHDSTNYEIEFVDAEGESLEVLTVSSKDIKAIET